MVIAHKLFWLARYGMGAIQQPSKFRGLLGLKLAAFQVHWFPPEFEPSTFPSLDQALATPPGLLAVGGKTSADAMLRAFEGGVFICNQAYQPAKWWAPDPRMVLFPEEMYLQKTIQRLIRNDRFVITFDQAFSDVVDACAEPRAKSTENWIPLLADAYKELHRRGHAFCHRQSRTRTGTAARFGHRNVPGVGSDAAGGQVSRRTPAENADSRCA